MAGYAARRDADVRFDQHDWVVRGIVDDVMRSYRGLSVAMVFVGFLVNACTRYELAARDTAPGKTFDPLPPNTGQICVIRPHNVALLVPAVVRDNRQLVGMTKGPTWFCWLAEPGVHKIMTRYGDDIDENLGTDEITDAAILVEAGGRYYLHHDVSKILTLSVRWILDPAEANAMISECQWADLVAGPSEERLPGPGDIVRAAR